jgi:hypothetical protein
MPIRGMILIIYKFMSQHVAAQLASLNTLSTKDSCAETDIDSTHSYH